MNGEEVKKLYNALINKGYKTNNIGDEQTFIAKMGDKANRKELYDYVSSRGDFRIGDYDNYERRLTSEQQTGQSINTVPTINHSTSPTESSLSPEASAMIDELKAKIRDVKPVQRESSLQELVDRQREADKQSSRRLPQLRQEVARPDAIRQEQIILPVEHSDRNDEERDIDSRFKPREAASPEDIYSNYIDRFALTRRGQELQSELVDIQRGVNDRYAGEFLQSDEYRALADRYTGQELNNKANEDFNRIYGERINKDMQPYIMAYQDEVLKRYGDRINEDMKQLTKEQVAGDIDKLSASVGKQLGDAHSRLSQQGGTGGNVMNVLMGSRRYNTDKAINAERRQLGELEVAQNLLNDSKEIIAEAQKRGNTNFMAGLGRGLYDTVFDADTWSMGLTDLREGKLLMDVLDKFDRGERLNDSEQALMDAAVANLATNAYYYSDLGRGYKAGMTTGQSIPFMLEFAINPVSGSGSAIAKSILRYGMKKFGAKTAKRGVSRMAARLAGDALAATGLTGTTGSARVAAGTMERMTGDIQLDNTGRHYAGRTGQQSAGEALGKSFASSFLENQSEMVFNAFKGFGPVVWAQAERVLPGGVGSLMDDALTGKTWNFYRKLKSSPVLVEAAKRTQFHGLFGEYAEELYNNFANIPLGEMTLEEATDLDNNIDTFLGLAPTSVAFSLLGLGGLAHERYRYRRQKQRMLGQMTEEEREKMTKLEELSKERGNEDIKRFIKETITATNLTPEEKKQEIAYAYNIAVNNALDDVDKARKQEVRNNHDASFREGQAIYEEHDPTQMRQTVLRREVALERLTGMGIDEQSIQELGEIPVEEREEKLSTYTDDVRDAALDYLNALDREAGMNDAMDKAHAGEVEHARNLLGEITASSGNVTLVPLGKYGSKDAQWGVVVKGLDANGMPTQSNGALMVYPIQMDNNVPVFSSINEDSPLTVIPESMIDAMIVSPDDALRGMLSSYQQDADIQEGTPIAPQSSFPILDEAGAVQTVTVLGNDGAGNWILQMPDGSVSSPIADDVLRKRKRDAEIAPILQEYAAASQVQEEARKEVDKEESVAQQKGTTTPQTAAVPKPKVGDRFTVDGKTAVVKEIAPDGIIVDYVNEEGDITGADQLTFSTYSEALSLLKTASEYTPSTGATSTSGEQSGIGTTEQSPKSQQRALDRIPKDEKGQPLYEQADPETAWDAIVEQAGGDEAMASSIVSDLVNERKKAYDAAAKNLKIVEAGKPQAKKGDGEPTMEERVEAKREARKMLELARAEVERTRNAYDTWQRIAQVKQQREKAIREPKEDGQNEIRPAMSSNSQIAENSAIPVDKDGKPLYHTVPVDVTLADLNDGSLDANEVDAFIEENAKAALQLLKKTSEKPPKIGTDKAKYLADKQAWRARVDDARAQVDYWQQVADELAARRERPGDRTAAEILAMGEPMDGEELAAQMLANGSLPLLRESYLRETGAGNEEARGMLGLFASKEKGGLTIEQAGEKLMLADSENGTHFFDPNDANAGRDALISVLSAAKTRGDLTNFIRNRRAEQARREQEAEREAYDSWCEANFHMSAEEYEAYENESLPLVGESLLTEEQYVEFISIFGEELNRRNDETRRIDTENTSNEPGRAAGIPERSGTVLSEEETVPSGRAGTTETRPATAGTRVGTADGAVQGSASGREERISRTTIDPRLMTETERKRRGDMLRNASAVDVEVGQIVSTPELSARKVAEKWWDANVPEPVFYDTEVGEVEINKNSVESSLAHRYSQAKLDAITSLVDGFENAVYLGTLPDGRERGVIDHYFAYPIEYKGKRNYVFCRVMQDANKNRLYVHEVFVAENIKKGDTLQTAASKPHGGIALYKDILANVLGETVTKTEPQQSSNAVSTGSSLSENEGDGITSSEPNGEPTVSFHKNTDKSTVTQTIGEKIAQAEAETDTNPTDGQKEAGNYKKGHVRIGQFDITVENPKGSVRRGTHANGNPWQTTMHNTYGYIRGTEGVDGDHIDVFLTDDIDGWNGRRVYVVDQYNEDGTFDEHKVMLGFNDEADARDAYFSNYSKGWADNRKIVMTSTNLEDFEKWIDSSHRKTKPFAEYKSVQNAEVHPVSGYDIEQRYHKKKDTYVYAVKFTEQMPREQFLSLKKRVKDFDGYYSSYGKGGFIFDTEDAGRRFAEAVLDPSGEKLEDEKPLSLSDMQQSNEPAMRQVDVEGLMQTINRDGEAKLSDHFVVGSPGLTEKATSKQTNEQTSDKQPQQTNDEYGANNKLVSHERYEELKKRMRQKLGGQLNVGIDPETLAIGTEMAVYHIEAGARKFADYARRMIDDLGDAIRPYLKSFYNGVRDLPEVQEAGYADEMTPYDEVRTFDTANFDKPHTDVLATAEMVVAEQKANRQVESAKEQLTNQRNEQRRKEDEQRTADTETVAGQAEVVASKAESDIEAATDEKEVNEAVRKIDEQLDKVNEQLALLGYYKAEPVESDFNEAYGYMRNAEKKAVKDANNLANRLVKDLGIDPETIVDNKGKRRRSIATANIAPIGGDISIHLPLGEKRELYISIRLDNQEGDNLKVTGGMLRIENPTPERGEERYLSSNNFFAEDETYQSLLHTAQQLVKHYAPDFVPVSNSPQEASSKAEKKPSKQQRKQKEPKIVDLFSAQEENVTVSQDNSSFQKGDAVIYQGKPATVYDIEDNGRLMLDTGLAPVLYESADPKEVKPANTATLHVENTEINRMFANAVKTDMLAALDSGTKPYRSILDLRKRAAALGMEVDHDGRTDILLQELVEDGLVRAAREVVEQYGRDSKESYDLICKLYDMQPTIAARSSNRIKMQQYSTPLPMAWNAARFAMSGKKDGKVLEPTAGNGMLVFAVPARQVHANELDETRLDNLREQGFARVTQQDATELFEGGQQYDVIIANPPFGKRDEVEYDGKMIPGLDPQITLNALASMKDDGKAAIIIGGNMEYGNNGGLKSMKPFFTYLYDHYNVKGVIDMDGKLYSKQGTTFPTRMILIAGRRSDEERAQTAVYPPVESKAIRKADSFDDLYDIIDEVINSKEKTNGTEILRSQQGQLVSVADQPSRNTDGTGHSGQSRKNDDTGHGQRGTAHSTESNSGRSQQVLSREHRTDTGNGETRRGAGGNTEGGSRGISEPDVQRVGTVGVSTERVGLGETRTEQPKKRTLTEEKSAYRPHNSAFSLQSVAPAAMVEAMDNVLTQIETENGNIDEFVRKELGYDTIEETHQALAAEQIDSVAMAIYQMKQGQALIIGDQTGVGKGRQMAALIRWAVKRGEKPIFITQKADLFSDIYRDLVDIGSGDLVPFIFNSPSAKENKGEMVDANGKVVYRGLPDTKMKQVMATGKLPDEYDYAVLTYSQVNSGDEISQKEAEEAAKKRGGRTKKSKASKDGKATPKATFLRAIAEDNYLFLDESHTAAGTSNTGAYLQSILRSAKAATFASATFAKRPDTMPLYAIRTAMSQAKVEPDKLIGIIEKGGVTLQEIMSRELTNAGQMVRRERDMSDVVTDWKTINDPATVKRARENYDHTIAAFNAIIKFQEDYVKPMVDAMDKELAVMAESAGIKRGTDKMGVENVPFASKTYNYTKQLMLALKVDAIADEVEAEIKAGRHPVIALESTMESTIKDYSPGDIIEEPTFSASLLKGLDTVMQYTVKDENGKEQHARYSPKQLGEAGEKAYYELQDFIRESTSDIFISPLDAIIERLHGMGYKVGELTGRNVYVERDDDGRVVVRRRTDKDKKRMQREFNSGELDVLILNKSASTGISLHASEKFSDQRQRTMIIAQPLSDINDYMQMIGRIDRTGQVHRGYYINLGLPVPAENRFLMMLSTKLKSLNANTTTSQDSESNDVEAPDLLNKYGSQVVVEYLRDNPDIYEKMGTPLKKGSENGGRVQTNELDEYKPQEDDARKITGYVALLTTKEQEEFYDDVVRRYNELIKYLNDTGSNDLKITVMPLRAKTLNKRVSSEGIDPTGTNPFARNSYVEQVEMDVLRKPMKAAEIRKTIEQVNKGKRPEDYVRQLIATIDKEDEARIAAEEARYERSKVRAQEDIAKQTDKINRQQKRTAEEKQAAIADYARETNENVESKHNDNMVRLNTNSDMLKQRLHMFEVGKSYLMPDNLESTVFDFSTPAIFCGYKAKDSKITASTTLAVFATLDGRRRMEIKLSQPEALRSIYKTTNDNWDAARSTTLENWDSQIPTGTRKTGFIMTGNILQAIADTQDEYGGYPGQLISYTDIDGNVHDGILMPDKWNTSMLKTSGAPIISRLKQIKDYMPVTSHDGKVDITGSSWAKVYYLTVPKTKKDGAVYYENKALLRAVNGSNFYPYRGKLRADIPAENIEKVVRELSKLGVKVKEETNEDDALYRLDDYTTNEEEANDLFRVVDDASEIERLNSEPTVKVYRAMSLVDGKLYPPMSKKIGTGSNRISQAPSEFGQWEVSDERPELVEKEGAHKNHIYIVKDNGKGLWVAYNPYFHTSRNPLNDQFAEAYQRPNLVTVEVEVPESELTSGYQAEGAKDPVGETKWNAGPVNRQLSGDKKRKVILSRWMRPVRIVPDSEVAQRIAELIEGENVAIPDNTVTPSLLEELKKLGVKIVDGISKGRKKATAMLRGGDGMLTDDELSYENDPVAKMTGRSTRTAAQRRAFAIRERQRMVTAVQELAEKLHLDNVDIVTDASTLQGERAKAKGFYSRSTGRITIVISNHRSVFDAEQTLLHEAVAHYGLRQLFGSHFNTFLDNVFRNADEAIRQKIVDLSKKHNWNIHTATEEYLASLAENTDFENINASWWQKIKEFFLNMLHKIGFEDFSGVTLSDNELRYILWRSYENLAEPGRYRSILGTAVDTRKQYELGVGNFASSVEADTRVAESTDRDDDVRFRFSDRPAIIQEYDKAVSTNEFRFQEAFQDSMLSLKLLQNVIEKYSKKRIRSFENAYTAENRLSSLNKIDNERYIKNYFEPLLDVVKKLSDKYGRQKVEDYIYAKSGLERNDVLLHRDAKAAYDEGKAELDDKLDKGKINQDQYDVLMQQVQADYEKKLAEGGDYSGLEGLVLRDQQDQLDEDLKNQVIDKLEYNRRIKEIKAQYKTHAEELVRDFESEATQEEIDSLWQHINNATNATLDKLLESGMLSQERYEEIKNMMQYYVPLKGWQEDIAEDVYDYTRRETPVQKEKKAKGRKSLADNPIAQIALSAQNAIILGNRNKMKQRFYNFVINRPNELAVIANVWYAHTYNTVHGQVEKVYPDINENDSPETIMQKMDDFEKRMQKEKEEGRAYRGKVPFGMELKTKSGQRPEHFVSLMINGIEYVIYINGDPRAAQALNGKTNPEGEENIFWEYYNRLKRLYGGGLTSNNPDFVAANFVRDTIQSATMEYMNKGFLASAHYLRNIPKSFAAVSRGVFEHYNPNRQTDVYFKEFIENGGETGYTAVHTIEDYKKEYERALQEIRGIRKTFSMTRDGLNAVIKCLETANRIAEDVNRFNAYMSSRQAGYGIEDSIDAAKNISVNFNKKGALGKGKGVWAALAWFMNKWILFFNPAVQGLYQVGQAAKNHKKRVLKTLGTIMASGFVMPMLNELLVSALGGGDDDDYFNQTDYTRMNNWLIYVGGGYIKIPLPPLFREVYGLGDILYRVLTNRMTPEKAAVSTARQVQSAVGFINLIPEGEPSVQEAVGGLMPDLVAPLMDVAFNRDFMGHDIAKVTDYTKNLPEYERVYKGVSPVYVEISRILNNVGGNDALRSHFWGTFINPAYMEHIITSYTGGIGKTMSNLTGMVVDVTTGDWGNIEPRTIPVVNRFINPVTEKTVTAAVNRVFYEYRDRYEELRVAEKRYKQFINDGRTEFKDEFEQMQESGEIEFINYFKQKMKTLRKMEDRLKDNPGDKELEMRIREFKAGMIMKAKEILK